MEHTNQHKAFNDFVREEWKWIPRFTPITNAEPERASTQVLKRSIDGDLEVMGSLVLIS